MVFNKLLVSCALISIYIAFVQGEAAPCRFDTDYCSCKFGSSSQGICWDRIDGTPSSGVCRERYCKAGWTCACFERTHLCPMKTITRSTLISLQGSTPYCRDETDRAAAKPVIELGSWFIGLSRSGMLQNECKDIKWWHNGELLGVYGDSPDITSANIAHEMQRRGNHSSLELRRGDLLAFRIRNASYYCFTGISTIQVNGQDLTLADSSVSAMFARQHTDGWFKPSFVPTIGQNESIAQPADFVPLRTQLFSNGSSILPGTDYWRAPDGTRDHERGNFYFRIRL